MCSLAIGTVFVRVQCSMLNEKVKSFQLHSFSQSIDYGEAGVQVSICINSFTLMHAAVLASNTWRTASAMSSSSQQKKKHAKYAICLEMSAETLLFAFIVIVILYHMFVCRKIKWWVRASIRKRHAMLSFFDICSTCVQFSKGFRVPASLSMTESIKMIEVYAFNSVVIVCMSPCVSAVPYDSFTFSNKMGEHTHTMNTNSVGRGERERLKYVYSNNNIDKI